MHRRFGRDWPEQWHSSGGCQLRYADEYYWLQRKEYYDERKANLKPCLEHWEHNGFGYFLYHREGENEWLLSRIDLEQYYGIAYTFYSQGQLEARVEREGWRRAKQMTLQI